MDKRFPFDSPRDQQPRNPPTVGNMTPLELEEALFFQRRQEMQRDLQLRQMLLQEQIDNQQALHRQRIFELHQHIAGQQAFASRHNEEILLQDQLRRLELQRHLQQNPHLALSATTLGSPLHPTPTISAEALVADSLTANAARRPSGNRKRSLDRHDDDVDIPAGKRHAVHKDSISKSKKDKDNDELMDDAGFRSNGKPKAKGKSTSASRKMKFATDKTSPSPDETMDLALDGHDAHTREIAEALASVEANGQAPSEDDVLIQKGTIEDLIAAADGEVQVDEAAALMVGLQNIDWPESEWESSGDEDYENRIKIILPHFKSKLPRLPVEPEYDPNLHKDTYDEEKKADQEESLVTDAVPKTGTPFVLTEYPYPVDTWWPSVSTIKRERRMYGEKSDDEDFVEEPGLFSEDSPFRADQRAIKARLANEVEPGLLEKVPHCRIHRMKTRLLKGATIPDHAFCWQVTESYCTDIMVCCVICSTWRHAGCGGHYQPFSVRESIETNTPIVPICDRCHAEQVLLKDFPEGKARLERQRIEQLRRGLSTSAVIRQASFVKHGGTYKWPLGSVSTTHIGGHTRSVHSRHDKAEKQWAEMANRLGRGCGYRPKERIKVRTREFERLLVCVEDAEGITDRHNMMQFLQHDSRKEYPAGFEKHLRNLFDPDDDEDVENGESRLAAIAPSPTQEEEEMEAHVGLVGRRPPALTERFVDDVDSEAEEICARRGCCKKPRFDSAFCSDLCGVAALEYDLFRSLQLAEEMHPSLMRT